MVALYITAIFIFCSLLIQDNDSFNVGQKCNVNHSYRTTLLLENKLKSQATWNLVKRKENAKVIDIISILGRFEKREDFYQGQGYQRQVDGGFQLLTKESFYENIQKRQFKKWPLDKDGNKIGFDGDEKEFQRLFSQLQSSPASLAGSDAVFTSFAKGAENGLAYPAQVDEEMAKWLSPETGAFDLSKLESSLLLGKLNVFIGWFLYIGLQFGGVYVVFFVPIMSQFFPDVDFYPIQTALHTSTWGK